MRFLVLIYLSLFIFSCASTYQEEGFFTTGYKELKIADETYEVKFYVNAFTSAETAAKYLLYRCAELTTENGFKYFEVLSQIFGFENAFPTGGSNRSKAEIRMFNKTPEKLTENIYNAKRFLMMNSDVKD